MINDTSIFVDYSYSEKIKSMIICKDCQSFPILISIYLKKEEIFISYKCKCAIIEKQLELKLFIEKFKIDLLINDSKLTNNNCCYSVYTLDNKEITIDIPQIPNYDICKCYDYSYNEKFFKIKYYFCGDCNKILCNCCRKFHLLHRVLHEPRMKKSKIYATFYPRQRINKQEFKTIFSIITKKTQKKKFRNKYEQVILKYYNKNVQQTELLFYLYNLLYNNYEVTKDSPNLTNYVNLKFFSFQYGEGFQNEGIKDKELLIHNFLLYCKTNFWIKIDGAIGYFSSNRKKLYFPKEIKYESITVYDIDDIHICIKYSNFKESYLFYYRRKVEHYNYQFIRKKKLKIYSPRVEVLKPCLFYEAGESSIICVQKELGRLGCLQEKRFCSTFGYIFLPLEYNRFAFAKNRKFVIRSFIAPLKVVDEVKYKVEEEKNYIQSLFLVDQTFLFIVMEQYIKVMNINTFKIESVIPCTIYAKECYTCKSLNIVIISAYKQIYIINLKTFQIITVILYESQYSAVGIINDNALVIQGRNNVQLISLRTFTIITQQYFENLYDVRQITNNRFLFIFSSKNEKSLLYYYL